MTYEIIAKVEDKTLYLDYADSVITKQDANNRVGYTLNDIVYQGSWNRTAVSAARRMLTPAGCEAKTQLDAYFQPLLSEHAALFNNQGYEITCYRILLNTVEGVALAEKVLKDLSEKKLITEQNANQAALSLESQDNEGLEEDEIRIWRFRIIQQDNVFTILLQRPDEDKNVFDWLKEMMTGEQPYTADERGIIVTLRNPQDVKGLYDFINECRDQINGSARLLEQLRTWQLPALKVETNADRIRICAIPVSSNATYSGTPTHAAPASPLSALWHAIQEKLKAGSQFENGFIYIHVTAENKAFVQGLMQQMLDRKEISKEDGDKLQVCLNNINSNNNATNTYNM